ncbi:MAG: hypothetical protein FWD71_08280 [Oscillospiraceae bacterium]|nr:hypothetical protein [Oscillospiraceae bacterium]
MVTTNDSYIIITDYPEYGPIVMTDLSEKKDLFKKVRTGDLITVTCGSLAQSYPGQMGVYSCKIIKKGSFSDIPKDIYNILKGLGWVAKESEKSITSLSSELTESSTQPTISQNETASSPDSTTLASSVTESTWPIATPSALPPINNDAVALAKNATVKKSFAEIVSSLSDNINLSDPFDGTIDDGIEYALPWKYTEIGSDKQSDMFLYNTYFAHMFPEYSLTPCDITDEKPVITMKWYFHPNDGRKPYKLTLYVSASCVWFDYNDMPFPQRYLAYVYTDKYYFLVDTLNAFMLGYKCNDSGQRLTVW